MRSIFKSSILKNIFFSLFEARQFAIGTQISRLQQVLEMKAF